MSLKRLRCPAYPMCTAEYVVHFPDGPGQNSWGTTVRHVVPSGSMMNERCPASGIRVTWVGRIKGGDRERINVVGADWVRRTAEALATRANDHAADEIEQGLRELLQIGREPDRPRDDYFPGRPADVPEPGVGERPAGLVPWDIGGGLLGRAAVDNARDQLRTLLTMAIEEMGAAQDTLARMTALVDSVGALAEAVKSNLTATSGLLAAAIGTGDGLSAPPEPAARMQAQVAAAVEGVTRSESSITESLKVKIEQTFSQVGAAIEAAREYQAIP